MKRQSLRFAGVAVLLLSASTVSLADGIFSRHSRATPPPNGAMPDCSQIVRMPNSGMTLETCEQMVKAQQAYMTAAADPAAARPGDEQMSCEQIRAEMKQQNIHAPDAAKAADASAAISEKRTLMAKQTAETTKAMAEEQAKVDAAAASDRAVQLASGGIVQGHAAAAAAEAAQARGRVEGERMAKESAPTNQKMMSTTSDLMADMSQQLQANPRMARLMQLAQARRCKGG